MADTVDVKVTGVETAIANLKNIGTATPTATMRGTVRVAAKVERQAKANAPVDTGRLRASISHNWTGSGKNRGDVDSKAEGNDGVGQPQQKPDTFTAVIGTNVKYAPHVEFNETATHKTGGAHFLYSAYFSLKDDVKEEIASEWGKEIAKSIKRGTK